MMKIGIVEDVYIDRESGCFRLSVLCNPITGLCIVFPISELYASNYKIGSLVQYEIDKHHAIVVAPLDSNIKI